MAITMTHTRIAAKCMASAGYRYSTRRYTYKVRWGATALQLWRAPVGRERDTEAWEYLGNLPA